MILLFYLTCCTLAWASPPRLSGIFLEPFVIAPGQSNNATYWQGEFEAMQAAKIDFVVVRALLNGQEGRTPTAACPTGYRCSTLDLEPSLDFLPRQCVPRSGTCAK